MTCITERSYPARLLDVLGGYMLLEADILSDLTRAEKGSVEYATIEMKRLMFIQESMEDVNRRLADNGKHKSRMDDNKCDECGANRVYDQDSSSNICPRCGVSVFQIYNDVQDATHFSNYNRNPKHYYRPREHFFQTLLDMTCRSRRKVPIAVVRYCRTVLGKSPTISSADVYSALQSGGYKQHYASKYEIAAMLRGCPEIVLTPMETDLVRGHYNRYDRCFSDFQRTNAIGKRTISRRTRVFWPVRYVMGKMFVLIGRDDLLAFIRPIVSKKRQETYDKWWMKLEEYVERLLPNPHRAGRQQHKRPKPRRVRLEHLGSLEKR